jgi:hypothetical protein
MRPHLTHHHQITSAVLIKASTVGLWQCPQTGDGTDSERSARSRRRPTLLSIVSPEQIDIRLPNVAPFGGHHTACRKPSSVAYSEALEATAFIDQCGVAAALVSSAATNALTFGTHKRVTSTDAETFHRLAVAATLKRRRTQHQFELPTGVPERFAEVQAIVETREAQFDSGLASA